MDAIAEEASAYEQSMLLTRSMIQSVQNHGNNSPTASINVNEGDCSSDDGSLDEDGELKASSRIFIYSTQDMSMDVGHDMSLAKNTQKYASSLLE